MSQKPTYEELEKRVEQLKQTELQQKKTEALLRESEERFKALHNASFGGIAIHDKGVILDCNQGLSDICGFTNAELVGMNGLLLIAPEWRESVMEKIQGDYKEPYIVEGLRKDGSRFDLRVQGKNIPYQGRKVRVTEFRDITDRKQAEAALLESEKKYRRIYDNILDVYYEASLDGIILEISPSVEKISDYTRDELIGASLYDIYSNPVERDHLISLLGEHGQVNDHELNLTDKDGSERVCSINTKLVQDQDGKSTKLVGILRDISERKQAEAEKKALEEKLARAHKMEAIGLLAGGVAHDLNNVLSGIVSYPDLLLADLPQTSPLRKPILTIKNSGHKAADIVQDLLTLARRGVLATEVLNLNDIVSDYAKSPEYITLTKEYPDVRIDMDLDPNLLNIKGSGVHLRKALMNLVLNAAESQPIGGSVMIATRNTYIDTPVKGYEDVREGDFVLLEVSDKGTGIAAEDLNRIFEPFYTKKVMGRSGTGLGMAVVWGTVQDHNGYIHVESAMNQGTTFHLYFPIIREKMRLTDQSIPMEHYMGNNERILIVDDIKAQREIAASILRRLNYSVVAVSNGEAAIEYLRTDNADLIVLDMIMDPGIDGLETYKGIIEHSPRQKAIIASGFSETDRVAEMQALGAGDYIKKPYTMEKLGMAVKNALGKS